MSKNVPVRRCLDYRVEQINEQEYVIVIHYFLDKGNPINDIQYLQKQNKQVSAKNLSREKKFVDNNIKQTKLRLTRELRRIGASSKNARIFMSRQMQDIR